MTIKQKGFTLIELLIVVAIIGVLAAIAVPNLLNALNRARQKRTMADMRTIATAWEARAADINRYNSAGVSWPAADALATTLQLRLAPTYVKKLPIYDGWNEEFRVSSNNEFNYTVKSFGADRLETTPTTTAATWVATDKFDCDIILSNGYFVVYPEGGQTQ
jgi:type II secretion system protein G